MTRDAVLAAMTGAEAVVAGHQTALCGVTLDSRTVQPAQVFFCVRGAQSDGHDFADKAVAAGAGMLVAERDLPTLHAACAQSGASLVIVPDAVRALGELAHMWRVQAGRNGVRVIGITGTAGKTTVKEVLSAVLSRQGATAKNHLNHNNQIGLPQSMLAARGDEAFWVMEVGISHQHDMDELGAVLEPDVAIILNAGAGHTEGLGANVARHKARLLAWLTPNGHGLVGADYADLVGEAAAVGRERTDVRLALCGTADATAVGTYACRAEYMGPVANHEQLQGRYQVLTDGQAWNVVAPFQGRYGAENLSIIVAAAVHCGLSCEQITAGLLAARLPAQRFACSRHGNWQVVDDSYNANPLSFARMLESVADMARRDSVVLVCALGEMRELGSLAVEEHTTLGKRIAASGARLVLWCGGHADAVRTGLAQADFDGMFVAMDGPDGIARCAALWDMSGGVILFKGSRGNHLEIGVARFVTLVESRHAV